MKRSEVTLVILSEASVEGIPLDILLRECDEGACVLAATKFSDENLSGKEMADALYKAGSDPGFFMLDDEGNEVE